MKRILGVIAIAGGLALGTSWYIHRARIRALNSGDVFVREQSGDSAKPATPRPVPASPPAPEIATASPAQPPADPVEPPASPAQPPVSPVEPPASPRRTRTAIAVPASDSIPRNPPNGTVFAGAGKYQLYRQGDITWRVDTETGAACILFATDAQWSRTRIYQHGCGSNAEISSARGN